MPGRASGVGLARLAALARSGQIQQPVDDEFHLLPDNWPVLGLWGAVQTQWYVGMAGPTGLNYPGVRASPAFLRIPEPEREDVFEGVCIMERAWLSKRAEIDKAKRSDSA